MLGKTQLIFIELLILMSSCVQGTTPHEKIASKQDSSYTSNELGASNHACIAELVKAAETNDLITVSDLLKSGCDVNGKLQIGTNHWTCALRNAVHQSTPDMTMLLLKYGADPNLDLGESLTPFHYAAGGSSISIFKLLYEHKGNIYTLNKESDWGTPLIWAISQGKVENVKFLIERKVSLEPDSVNAFISPLDRAVSNRHLEIAQLLLANGANINATFSEGSDDCLPCPYGITVMHRIVNMTLDGEATSEFLKLLLKYRPDLNIESESGYTPLEHACFGKNIELVDKLIKGGAKLKTDKFSSLHCAAMFSNYQVTKYLLENGADPNMKDASGNTPLMTNYDCCGDGFGDGKKNNERIKTIELLLKHNADPSAKNSDGESFLDKCNNGPRKELRDLMIKRGLLTATH